MEDRIIGKLPPSLVEAVRSQTAILFLGAAASYGSYAAGSGIPSANQLRDRISDRYLGGDLKDRSLPQIAELAINETSLVAVQQFIRDIFLPFEPAEFHKLIPTFRWHAIISTNYDLIVERAYEGQDKRLQNLVKFIKNGQNHESELKRTINGVPFLKLHGCIDHYMDKEIPLILATEQYARHSKNRTRLFERLRDWGREFTIIFCGYSVSDPHIQQIMFDLFDEGIHRPSFYTISPTISEYEHRYWSSHRVHPINMTFEDFITTLDAEIPKIARALSAQTGGGQSTLRGHYSVSGVHETPALLSALEIDLEHIRSGLATESIDPKEFYRGYDAGWASISQNLDISRKLTDSLIVESILSEDGAHAENGGHEARSHLYVVKGAAGNGKTIVLKRAAWTAANDYNKLVLFLRHGGTIRHAVLREIASYTSDRIHLFVDQAARHAEEIEEALQYSSENNIPLTIITAERDAEWNVRCDNLDAIVTREFPLHYLSEREIRALLNKLDEHDSLGLLAEEKDFERRVSAFMMRAERQLLVALHEVTRGAPFESIVSEEYHRIIPNEAQALYLDVCTLNRLGVPVRAGLISRVSGLIFSDFDARLFKPLEHIVLTRYDSYIRDRVYLARHQRVAEIVFDRVLEDGEQKYNQILRMLLAMNLDYSADREAFGQIVKGRSVAQMFESYELGDKLYRSALNVSGEEPFVLQQRAIFEMEHPGGNLRRAEDFASAASSKEPFNKSIRHTSATLARKRALESSNNVVRKQMRDHARGLLSGLTGHASENAYGYHLAAQLALDDLRDLLANSDGSATVSMRERQVVEATREVEKHLQEGRQRFPLNEHLLAVEADYRNTVDQSALAEAALLHAFRLNARQDWIASRLAGIRRKAGDIDGAKAVLRQCISENPSSKRAHFELAMLLMTNGTDEEKSFLKDYLRRAFTEGDQNYEAQFWFARQCFLDGEYEQADRIFSGLRKAKVTPGERNAVRGVVMASGDEPRVFEGVITTKEEGFAFVNVPAFGRDVFVHRSKAEDSDWEAMDRGARVKLKIGFNMKGPSAELVWFQ